MPHPENPFLDEDEEAAALVLGSLPERARQVFAQHFPAWAHAGQLPPPCTATGSAWRTWAIVAGRGFGKTRSGAEWVLSVVRGEEESPLPARAKGRESPVSGENSPRLFSDRPGDDRPETPARGEGFGGGLDTPLPPTAKRRRAPPSPARGEGPSGVRIALVAATADEARRVMVEGPSGILACARPGEVAGWSFARRCISFANGAQAFLYSGASPEGLRGPEHDFAWCDELAKWRHPQATWDNLQLGLRRGDWPRALVTTTPRACAALSAILDAPDTVRTGGSSFANPFLSEGFAARQAAMRAGTRAAREEVYGEMIADVEGSLWPAGLIEGSRVGSRQEAVGSRGAEGCDGGDRSLLPPAHCLLPTALTRIVIGVDPPASAAGTCGIVVCGLDGDGRGLVLADASVSGASPEGWARAVAAAAARWGADRVVAERNQGGDMVASVLRAADAALPVRLVHAARGKAARAEPVAALFECGRAGFAGVFPALEAELAGMTAAGGYTGPGPSPDRADAMVWALWALLIAPGTPPRVSAP